MMKKLIFKFIVLLLGCFVFGQELDLENDFRFVKSSVDTIYLVDDEFDPNMKLIFKTHKELSNYIENRQNHTGEIIEEYLMSVQEFPDGFISNEPVKFEVYKIYCQKMNLPIPKPEEFQNLDYQKKENYLNYLSNLWGVNVEEVSFDELEKLNLNPNEFYLRINQKELPKK